MNKSFDAYYFGLTGLAVILAGFNLSQFRKDGPRRIALALALISFGGICMTLALHRSQIVAEVLGATTFFFLVVDFALRFRSKGKPRS